MKQNTTKAKQLWAKFADENFYLPFEVMKLTTKENRSEREQIYVYIYVVCQRKRGGMIHYQQRERDRIQEKKKRFFA